MGKRIWGTLDPFHEPGSIMGRLVANEGFLRALAALDPFDEYHFFLADQGLKTALEAFFREHLPDFGHKARVRFRWELPQALGAEPYHVFHLSDCIVRPAHMALLRNRYARDLFPITATTHSLSYADYGQAFLKQMWPGCTPRDCVVATSEPGAETVRAFYRHLREGFGLDPAKFPEPSVERIPLGVDPEEFPAPSPGLAREAKQRLNIPGDRTILLVFGRIQHHSKMDPLPLFRALHRLFQDGLDKGAVRLVMAGWTEEGDDFPDSLERLARTMGLELDLVRRPDARAKLELFRAADVFVSMADNPQETFGITMLEAGAMGLPVIASEYDGYRDLILHEETGLLVPVFGPGATELTDALAPVLYDNQYHLLLSQQTAVSVPELAKSLDRLIRDPGLRAEMGGKARARVLENFTWEHVVRAHLELWETLWTRPANQAVRTAPHPLHIPYGDLFAHYPARRLEPDTALRSTRAGDAVYRGREFPVVYSGVGFVVDEETLRKILFLARKPRTVREFTDRAPELLPETLPDAIPFLLSWALKHDFLEVCSP